MNTTELDDRLSMREQVFNLLWELMYGSGGDGDSMLDCENPKLVADEFEKWLSINHPKFMKRREDGLSFTGTDVSSQESISFRDIVRDAPPPAGWCEYLRISFPLV